MALFSNQDIYKTYQDLLGQGMTYDQILAAAQRNPNLGLGAEQINAALAQYQTPKVTDEQLLGAGRTALQQGLDPQMALQRAADFGASQDQLSRLNQALGASGVTGLTTPTSTLGYTAPAATSIPGAPAPYSLGAPNITNEDILQAGRTRLQAGADPQSLLNELAANPSATKEQIQSAYNALAASGYTGVKMPGATTTGAVTGTTTGAGTAAGTTTGAATGTTGAATGASTTGALPAQGGTLTDQLLNAFTQGQRTGNYANFQSLLRQSKASASDIAAMFPQLSEQNVMDFAKQYGLSLEAPTRANIAAVMRDPRLEAESTANIARQLIASMGPGYENLLSDPKLLQQMREAAPTDYQQILLGGFNAAQRTGDFTKFNKMLADRDISETELRTLFPNITNTAIDEFKKRGLKFNALPDWIEKQNTFKDQSLAEQIATKWQQEYGRDISPEELKHISYGIGSMKSQTDANTAIKNIKAIPLTQSQEFLDAQKLGDVFSPSQKTLREAGLLDLWGGFEGGLPARYDWNAIANSKDPRAAMMSSNRQLLAMAGDDLATRFPTQVQVLGRVAGIPILEITGPKGLKTISIGSRANANEQNAVTKLIYQLGLSSDEVNQIADAVDKGSIGTQPGAVYKGSNAGLNIRDIAAGGYGTFFNPTQDPNLALKGQSAIDSANQYAWLAQQLGLARNPTLTMRSGLTGSAPIPDPSQIKYRPGERIVAPTIPTIGLRRLPGALPVAPKVPGG